MKHVCLKTGTRILSGILSMSMMAGILSMPVLANEPDTYRPVNDLKFTSNIKMNTEMETEEDGSTATDNTVQESEPASNENVIFFTEYCGFLCIGNNRTTDKQRIKV